MLSLLRRRLAADERGFAMVPVIVALAVSSLLVLAAVSAATGDLPLARDSQDRKAAYAAAESGLADYMFNLNADADFWKKCDQMPTGSLTPVSLAGASPRRWRTVPGTTTSYAIEVLPAPGKAKCEVNDEGSMVDPNAGTFRIRVTGRSNNVSRSVVTTFRRPGFLDFVYLTNFETVDPLVDGLSTTTAQCAQVRSRRASACLEIYFGDGDNQKGPVHTNDESILTCGAAVFGRPDRAEKDVVQVRGGAPGHGSNGCSSGSGAAPVFHTATGQLGVNAPSVSFPDENTGLETTAQNGGHVFTGKTRIVLDGDKLKVTNASLNGGVETTLERKNGLVYVKAGSGCSLTSVPSEAKYDEGAACAVATVTGTYSESLTIASAGDIIVQPQPGVADSGVVRQSGSPGMLGLIGTRYVRVAHPVTTDSRGRCINRDAPQDVRVDAAILSLQHSFIVDNHACGERLGLLNVTGAIAQNFRGPVGLVGGSGYTKNYEYDDRFKYRNPPYFLPPLNAAWAVVRKNEQVPAASGA